MNGDSAADTGGGDRTYRQGVGVILLNGAGLVLVGKRLDTVSDAWQMPQGGIDEGETPAQAAIRELQEEVGATTVTVIGESRQWYTYDLPHDLVKILWQGRYRGQRQKWFVMRFDGPDSEITANTAQPEFSACKWIEPARLPDVIVPFKRGLYRALLAEFAPLLTPRIGSGASHTSVGTHT
jgi:putative (di)nucleoside polyphosphate hydrolase